MIFRLFLLQKPFEPEACSKHRCGPVDAKGRGIYALYGKGGGYKAHELRNAAPVKGAKDKDSRELYYEDRHHYLKREAEQHRKERDEKVFRSLIHFSPRPPKMPAYRIFR